jgi:hypothetical protein
MISGPEASFEDRYSQFIAFGIPKADVDTLRATIEDMWADATMRLSCNMLLGAASLLWPCP